MSDEATKKTDIDISKPSNPDAKPGEPGHLSKPVADAVGTYRHPAGAVEKPNP